MSKALELSSETRIRLAQLKLLSTRAERGEPEARRELRKALRESADEVVEQASNHARRGQRVLASTLAADEPLEEEALLERLDRMRAEISGANPTPLEVLLVERIVSTWLFVTLLEVLLSAQLQRGDGAKRPSQRFLKFYVNWLESAQRRHLASIRELAKVRRLQGNTPSVLVSNTQINLLREDQR